MAHRTHTETPEFTFDTGGPDWDNELAKAFQPIVMGFLLSATVYYVFVSALHFFVEAPAAIPMLAAYTLTLAMTCLCLFFGLWKRSATLQRLEISSAIPIVLILALNVIHQLLVYDPDRLISFVLLIMAIVTAGVTLRLIIPAVIAALLASSLLATMGGPTILTQHLVIAIGGTFIALGMMTVMRTAIKRQLLARLKSDHLRDVAEHRAGHDELTGLPNRRYFFDTFQKILTADTTGPNSVTLGLLDLNGFKSVNDIHGHQVGDQLLIDVAGRLTDCCGPDVLVARLGGDEFAILFTAKLTANDLHTLGAEICAAIGEVFHIAGSVIATSASVGFAQARDDSRRTEHLYEQADFALYRAKMLQDGGVQLFSLKEEVEMLDLRKVEHQLLNCDRDSELFMLFQPQIDSRTGQTIGFEALARWRNAELGLVPPDVFIRAAERTGVITEITPLLFEKALETAKTWPDPIALSFNLSAKDIGSPEAIRKLCRIMRSSKFPAHRIEFEITETTIMTDFNRVRASIARLTSAGAKIALDDFGVGYANFGHIDELDVNTIKLDRTFVAKLGKGDNTGKIIKTIIDMCASLNAKCIIEGIETEANLRAVKGLGARYIQGFYFSRPLQAGQISDFLLGADRAKKSA